MRIDKEKNRQVHSRNLEITTYADEPESVILEGRLRDECFVTRYMVAGEKRLPGIVHDLVIRMRIKGPSLTIAEIEVDMPTVPRPECRRALNSLDPLVGMPITAGFTVRVKELIGGPKGCAHLVSLVLSMAPAAVQGAWSAISRTPLDPALYADLAMGFLTDTCMVWEKGGVIETEYREKLKGSKGGLS